MTRISCASARTTPQIVAGEEVGQAAAGLQLTEQLDDLRLHRHVERGGRLVEHAKRGFSTSVRAKAMRGRWPPENS